MGVKNLYKFHILAIDFLNYYFTPITVIGIYIFTFPFTNGESPVLSLNYGRYPWFLIIFLLLFNIKEISLVNIKIGKFSILIFFFATSFFLSMFFGLEYSNLNSIGQGPTGYTFSGVFNWTVSVVLIQLFFIILINLSIKNIDDIKHLLKFFLFSGILVNFICAYMYYQGYTIKDRLTGPFEDPNYLGRFEVFMLSILFIYLIYWKSKKYNKYLIIIFAAICLLFQILSYSRGSFVTLTISISLIILLFSKKYRFLKYAFIAGVFLLSSYILIKVASVRLQIGGELSLLTSILDYSNLFRIYTNFFGIDAFLRNPFFGIGFRNFYNFSINHLSSVSNLTGFWAVEYIHNYYISVLGEQGLYGFIPFILIVYFSLRDMLKKIKNVTNNEYKIIGMMIFSIALVFWVNGLFYPILVPVLELSFIGGLISGYLKIREIRNF